MNNSELPANAYGKRSQDHQKAKELEDFFQDAAGTNMQLTVCYGSGSKAGQPRKLKVANCAGDNLFVFENHSDLLKTYKISRVMWAEGPDGKRIDNPSGRATFERLEAYRKSNVKPEVPDLPHFDTFQEYKTYLSSEFHTSGWSLHLSDNDFGVGRWFKNGNPMKTPSIIIQFVDRSIEEYYDGTSDQPIVIRKKLTGRERPWRVYSWREPTAKTFSKLHEAMEFFVTEVRQSSPEKAKGMFAAH